MSEGKFQIDCVKIPFRWAVGIESSCIPHLSIDQYAWTQHDRFWREDLTRAAREIGCRWLRYSLPWQTVEPRPGEYDWKWADEKLAYARELGVQIILDLAHFGTPTWLPDAFGDVEFPRSMERFAEAFARRYSGLVHSVSPINEPLITALFCGDIGLWPPHGRNLRTYMTVLSRVAQGLSRSIRIIREAAPEMEIMVCDALEYPTKGSACDEVANPELRKRIDEDLALRRDRRHVAIDLITGRVNSSHPLFRWLEENGFSTLDLDWFVRNPAPIDALGLDYYSHSEMELYPCSENHFRQRVPEVLAGLECGVRDYWHRYGLPMMITETSCCGNDDEKCAWLRETVKDIRQLRAEGIPIIGYTWWPLLDHLDWDGAMLHQVGRIHPVGIYHLERGANGVLSRKPTALAQEYRELVLEGDTAAGAMSAAKEARKKAALPEIANVVEIVSRPADFPIVVHSHLPWDGVWQRPQQFMSRFSKAHRVLFVEGPKLVKAEQSPCYQLHPVHGLPNITIMRTLFPESRFGDGAWVDGERLRLLRDALAGPLRGQFDRPLQWFYDPMCAPFCVGRLDALAIVYDCMDELSQFKFAPQEIVRRERVLLEAADVVFAGGRKLHESKSRYNGNAYFYGCGVDFKHFGRAQSADLQIPFDVDFIHRPILGFFGVVDERMDYELIDKLAQSDPHWSIAVVGPVAKVDPNSLPNRVNIYWIGKRDYTLLPGYTKAFSVCLMPFAMNEATEYINPTKALEYMAAGKPIVSTAVPDVVTNFGEVVKIARSHEEFIELCRIGVRSPESFNIECGLHMAEQSGWDTIVSKMERHIRDVFRMRSAGQHQWRAQAI